MRQSYASRKLLRDSDNQVPVPIPSLPSSYSVHDFHNFNYQVETLKLVTFFIIIENNLILSFSYLIDFEVVFSSCQ